NRYLLDRGPDAPIKSLKDVIDFNERERQPLGIVDQKRLIASQAAGSVTRDVHGKAAAAVWKATRDDGLDAVTRANHLDCIVGPTLPLPASVSDAVNGDILSDSVLLMSYGALAGHPSFNLPVGIIS